MQETKETDSVAPRCGQAAPLRDATCERAAGHGSAVHWGWTKGSGWQEPSLVTWREEPAVCGARDPDGRARCEDDQGHESRAHWGWTAPDASGEQELLVWAEGDIDAWEAFLASGRSR